MLPTGKSFGGSNLNTQPSKIFTPADLLSKFVVLMQKSPELLIQLFCLILVTVWFWCILAAVRLAFGWERKIDAITQKPERVPFTGTLAG